MTTCDQLRGFVGEILQRRGDAAPFEDGDSLALSGRLDSVDVIELLGFLEATFAIDFARLGFDRNDFESISTMLALIERARSAA
jgi:acyl carrier protein